MCPHQSQFHLRLISCLENCGTAATLLRQWMKPWRRHQNQETTCLEQGNQSNQQFRTAVTQCKARRTNQCKMSHQQWTCHHWDSRNSASQKIRYVPPINPFPVEPGKSALKGRWLGVNEERQVGMGEEIPAQTRKASEFLKSRFVFRDWM